MIYTLSSKLERDWQWLICTQVLQLYMINQPYNSAPLMKETHKFMHGLVTWCNYCILARSQVKAFIFSVKYLLIPINLQSVMFVFLFYEHLFFDILSFKEISIPQ